MGFPLFPTPSCFSIMVDINNIRRTMAKKKTKKTKARPRPVLSSGSTVLNLAISGKPNAALEPGDYMYFVGDSMSGKTWIAMSILAEAANNPAFDGYRLIYDDAERGARMDIAQFFGKKMADRLEIVNSTYIEEFYFGLDDDFKGEKPFIRILDSMDCLDTFDDEDKFNEWKEAFSKGKDSKGSYGMSKAKMNSTAIRRTMSRLEETGSILVVISQTRDDINPRTFSTKTRAGGRALRFYATVEVWSSVVGSLKKTYKGQDRELGVTVKYDVKKNRLTGRKRQVEVPIYTSVGIDDIGSCVDYLIAEKIWEKVAADKNKGTPVGIKVTGIGPTMVMKREKLIRTIEAKDLEEDVRDLVGVVWQQIENAIAVERKKRYE